MRIRRERWILYLLAAACLAAAGCRKGGPPAADGHADGGEAHAEEPGDHGEPHAGEARVEAGGVRGVRFVRVGEPREEGAWFAAEAISDPGATATFSAPVSGLVSALRARPGQRVGAGTPLVEIRSPELARLGAAWLGAGARRTRAERDLERERRLLAAAATSPREVEGAEAEAAVARAEEQAARLELEARGATPGGRGRRSRCARRAAASSRASTSPWGKG